MIIDAIRKLYEIDAEERIPRGNPSGSRFGTCAAQSQMLRYRTLSQPEAPRPRHRITWEEGDRVEAWWSDVIERAFPNRSGMAQEPFYFAVPLTDVAPGLQLEADVLVREFGRRIELYHVQRALPRAERSPDGIWGTVMPNFKPPFIREETHRIRIKPVPREPGGGNKAASLGFVLDPANGILYAPTYIDRILEHPDAGLSVIEKKSMSNAAFRRAAVGNMGYGMRCQAAGIVSATNLPIVWLCYRKETGHLLELIYTPKADRVRIEIRKLNGQAEVYFRKQTHPLDEERDDEPVDLPGDAEWDDASTWTPYDADYLDAIRMRIVRVLAFTGDLSTLYREYGPDFTCPTCDGTRVQTRRKNGRELLKHAKACEDCTDGTLPEFELKFPCSYCPVVHKCWEPAGHRLELDMKPHHYVAREAFLASGLTFVSPVGETPMASPVAGALQDGDAVAEQTPETSGVDPASPEPEGSGRAAASDQSVQQRALEW